MQITAFDKKGDQLVAATVDGNHLISLTYHSFDEMLEQMLKEPDRLYVCEHSHATPKRYSKSQFWFPAQIEQLLAANVQLRVVAEAVTNRKVYEYRHQVEAMGFPVPEDQKGWKEKDEAVACALALHAATIGHGSLARMKMFDAVYDPLHAWAHEQRDEINLIWEILRSYADWDPQALWDYKGDQAELFSGIADSYDRMCSWLEGGSWQRLPNPDLFIEIFLGDAKPTPATVRAARKRVAAVWFCVFDSNDERRLFKGKPLGINNTLRHLLQLKEFHRRGGSHRAQIFWHSLRGSVRKRQGCTSPKSFSKFEAEDWEILAEQKRKFRRLLHDMVSDIAQTAPI